MAGNLGQSWLSVYAAMKFAVIPQIQFIRPDDDF